MEFEFTAIRTNEIRIVNSIQSCFIKTEHKTVKKQTQIIGDQREYLI